MGLRSRWYCSTGIWRRLPAFSTEAPPQMTPAAASGTWRADSCGSKGARARAHPAGLIPSRSPSSADSQINPSPSSIVDGDVGERRRKSAVDDPSKAWGTVLLVRDQDRSIGENEHQVRGLNHDGGAPPPRRLAVSGTTSQGWGDEATLWGELP